MAGRQIIAEHPVFKPINSDPEWRDVVRAFRFGDWMLLPTLGAGGWLYGFLQSGSSMAWGQKYTWSSHPRFISGTRVGVFSVFGAYLISFHTSKLRLQGWLDNGNGKAE